MSNANFPSILVSKRGQSQIFSDEENVFGKHFIGVIASMQEGKTDLSFTNEKGEIVETISPWFEGIHYGETIELTDK